MKFANKLFLAMTALLTIMFALFGIWMLSSDFSQLLNKEIEQGNQENNMFQFLFEMGYQSTAEFGEEYAVSRTLNSISGSVERGGSRMFVIGEDGTCFYGNDYLRDMGFEQEVSALTSALDAASSYGYCIRRIHDGEYIPDIVLHWYVCCWPEASAFILWHNTLRDPYAAWTNLQERLRMGILRCALTMKPGMRSENLQGILTGWRTVL